MKKISTIFCLSLLVSGCQHSQYQASSNAHGSMMNGFQPQPGYQQPVQQNAAYGYQQPAAPQNAEMDQISSRMDNITERVRRVERAMIRLDRRMQLVERNELSRMSSGGVMTPQEAPVQPQGMFKPMSYGAPQQQPARLPVVKKPYAQQNYAAGGYRPVSYQDNRITSSLGVASKKASVAQSQAMTSAFAGMPSLADKQEDKNKENAQVSIWTINYETGKVWPGREQLASSQSVVKALVGEEPVAVYARGARPSSKEFRDRVRAVSKYLSKVTNVTNVPIASMSAQHMSGDTIEILVTK